MTAPTGRRAAYLGDVSNRVVEAIQEDPDAVRSALGSVLVGDATTVGKGVIQLAGDLAGSAAAPVIAPNAVTTTKIVDGAVTSAKILDGTIVDGDINGSAAIAQSKVSGLVSDLAGRALVGLVSKNANYTLTATDSTISVDASGGARTMTLPTAVGATGRVYTIKRENAGTNAVTVATTSAQTIDGATTYVLGSPKASVTVQSTGTGWSVIGRRISAEEFFNVCDFGAKRDGTTDDTAAIQAAVLAAETSTAVTRTVFFPRGTYRTTGEILVQGTTGVRLQGYSAIIKADIAADVAALHLKTNPPNFVGGNKTTLDGLRFSSNNLGVGIGIYVDFAQEWFLNSVYMEGFGTGLKIGDSYYGGVGGNTSMYACTISVDIVSEAVNIIDLHNLKISGAGKLSGPTSYGIRSVAEMSLVKFDAVTIEGVDIGFQYARAAFGNSVIKMSQMYFEAIGTCAVDFMAKDPLAFITVDMESFYFNDNDKSAWIKLGAGGSYSFSHSNFKRNRIQVNNVGSQRLSFNTDIPIGQIDFNQNQPNSGSDGLVQLNGDTVQFTDGNPYLYNAKGDYNVYPTAASHLPSIIDARPLIAISPMDGFQEGQFFPMMSVSHRSQVFEAGGVVLKSPGGSYFQLTVDDAGTVTTRDVTSIKKAFAPALLAYRAMEIGRREIRGSIYSLVAEGASIQVRELNNRKVTKTSGIIVDGSTGTRTFGTTLEAVATTPGGTSFSPFFFDTDIEFFYCWQATYWGWCGSSLADASTLRAIGTLAQRPVTPAVASMRYYATDNTTRYVWNGTAWS